MIEIRYVSWKIQYPTLHMNWEEGTLEYQPINYESYHSAHIDVGICS